MKDKRGQIIGRVPITERPAIVEKKSRMGDLEIDLINSSDHDYNLLTINDRMTNMCILRRLPTKDADQLKDVLVKALKDYKKRYPLHTITSDNGKEFARHAEIARALSVDYCFAKPYHSWERGAFRRMLNNRPRKRLDFFSPLEYIYKQV